MDTCLLLTIAEVPESPALYFTRRAEYYYAIARAMSYKLPMFAVRSETKLLKAPANSAVSYFLEKFEACIDVPDTTAIGAVSKSQKEMVSMKQIVHYMQNSGRLHDDTWVIKVSARYLLVDDTIMNAVREAGPDCKFIGKLGDNNRQLYTFAYAIRFGVLRDFLANSIREVATKNIERFLVEFLQSKGHWDKCHFIDRLGVFVTVANSGEYVSI